MKKQQESKSPSLRIVMLNHNLAWTGTFFRCFHFARHLVRRGHEVTIFSGRIGSGIRPTVRLHEGVRVFEIPKASSGYLHRVPLTGIAWRCWRIMREPFDAIMAFDPWPEVAAPFLFGGLTSSALRIADWADQWTDGGILDETWPVTSPQYRFVRHLERWTKRSAHGVTAISRFLHDRALEAGTPPEQLLQVPSGADIETIVPGSKEEARHRLGLPMGAKVIAYAGITAAAGEISMLLEAFRIIEKAIPDSRLLLLGPWQSSISEWDGDPELTAKILAPGTVSYRSLGSYLAAADILAVPLREVGNSRARWPNKFGDYLAAGRPIVATALGDLVSVFQDHAIGLTSAIGTQPFAERITEALRNPSAWDEWGATARRVAESEFDWGILTARLEVFLLRLREKQNL